MRAALTGFQFPDSMSQHVFWFQIAEKDALNNNRAIQPGYKQRGSGLSPLSA